MTEEIPAVGTILAGQYRLMEVVGEGGMGVIYRARQEPIGRDVAVKILRARFQKDESVVSRFQNEARIVSQLRHPNTIRLYDTQTTPEGRFFIVTEFLRGRSLESRLAEGPLPVERAIHIVDQVAASLSEAHAIGVVHRDLKPANIFLDHVDGEDHVKVLDFGIAKLLQGAQVKTQANIILGTPGYMAPEQVQGGQADARSDIYALGVLLYQLLAGEPPFSATNPVQLLMKQIEQAPPPLAPSLQLPPALETLVLDMLKKSPDERPQHVGEVRERLRHIPRSSLPALSRAMPIIDRSTERRAASPTRAYSPDNAPTQAWDRSQLTPAPNAPSPVQAPSQAAHAVSMHMSAPIVETPATVTVPIEMEPSLDLGPSGGLELFLDDLGSTRPEAPTRTSSRMFIKIGVGLMLGLAAATGAYLSLDQDPVVTPLPLPAGTAVPASREAASSDTKRRNVVAPASNVATPASNAPASNVATPASNVATPASNVATPASNVATPASNVATPASNVPAPASSSAVKATRIEPVPVQEGKATPVPPTTAKGNRREEAKKRSDTTKGRSNKTISDAALDGAIDRVTQPPPSATDDSATSSTSH